MSFTAGDEDLTFTAEPQDTVVNKNASVVIDCGAPAAWLKRTDGGPSPLIEWKRDGVLLSLNGGETRRSVLSNGSLYFNSVQHTRSERPDEGLYQCAATRPSVGTIISRAAKLQIAALPRFELEPKDVAVRVGDTARFNCLVLVSVQNGPAQPISERVDGELKERRQRRRRQRRQRCCPLSVDYSSSLRGPACLFLTLLARVIYPSTLSDDFVVFFPPSPLDRHRQLLTSAGSKTTCS